MLLDRLTQRPTLQKPTYRLIRLRDQDRGYVLTSRPLFLPSHWINGRSFPCTKPICDACPWCKGQARREHAYLGLLRLNATSQAYPTILELPPSALYHAEIDYGTDDLFGAYLCSSRPARRAKPRIELRDLKTEGDLTTKAIDHAAIIRTLAKVYGLPSPDDHRTDEEWSLAVALRTNDPHYSPARSQPPAE